MDWNWIELRCVQEMCDDVSDWMCVVYILTSQNICQPIFVWGKSNQYYMVNTCLWQRHTLTFNNL